MLTLKIIVINSEYIIIKYFLFINCKKVFMYVRDNYLSNFDWLILN